MLIIVDANAFKDGFLKAQKENEELFKKANADTAEVAPEAEAEPTS